MATVRTFQPSDADAVHRMMLELATKRSESAHQMVLKQEFGRFFGGYMKGFLDNPDAHACVAEHDGQVIGYAVSVRAREQPTARFRSVAVLQDIYVDPTHRTAGVGKQLMAVARAWAEENGMDAFEVSADPEHADEVASLEQLGFLRHRLQMVLPLKPAGT